MKLSIVIPCYNCSANIVKIIDLLHQQINEQVEVIFINDGSLDNTEHVIRNDLRFHEAPNFHLYNYKNAGAAAARARGLDKAIGEYIFFLDSDDLISPDFIRRIFLAMLDKPDMIYFSSVLISSTRTNDLLGSKVSFQDDNIVYNADEFLYSMLTNKNWTSAVWSYVFRRELYIRSNAYFTNRVAHEDHIFSLRLVGNSESISIINQVLYFQKRTVGSLTNSKKDRSYILERFKAFEESRDDMKLFFSLNTISSYEKWSLISCVHLFSENISVVWPCFFSPIYYKNILKYKKQLFNIIWTSLHKSRRNK